MLQLITVFLTILLIEIILSVDNASVLAVIVNKNLDDVRERKKALRYGIIGAYVFRGLSLFFVSWIMYNPFVGAWFKIAGGLYLCYLFYTHLTPEVEKEIQAGWLQKICNYLGITKFWTTVIMVEFLDIVFSMDNLVAVVGLSKSFWLVCAAVALGILGMRFVAQYFSSILEKYPSLENSAFVVILLLGIKMALAGVFDFFPGSYIHEILNGHYTDMIFSLLTLIVFAVPILKSKFKSIK